MSKPDSASPEGSATDRLRFLERAIDVAGAAPSSVTLLLAAGIKRFAVNGASVR